MSEVTINRDLSQLKKAAETACRLLFQECYKVGIRNIFITETYRSQERQKYLYAQGRTRLYDANGKRLYPVTWTLTSNHMSRLAWDIAVGPPNALYDANMLTKVGAIARKLNITWGGDWLNTIDRPHFQVKDNWSMPSGYKLEGEVIVPSNSSMKVQLLVKEETKEEDIMTQLFNPGSPAMFTEAENFLSQAVQDGIIQDSHLKDLKNRTMTTDRLLGLLITINQRRSKKLTESSQPESS